MLRKTQDLIKLINTRFCLHLIFKNRSRLAFQFEFSALDLSN